MEISVHSKNKQFLMLKFEVTLENQPPFTPPVPPRPPGVNISVNWRNSTVPAMNRGEFPADCSLDDRKRTKPARMMIFQVKVAVCLKPPFTRISHAWPPIVILWNHTYHTCNIHHSHHFEPPTAQIPPLFTPTFSHAPPPLTVNFECEVQCEDVTFIKISPYLTS